MWMFCVWARLKPRMGGSFSVPARCWQRALCLLWSQSSLPELSCGFRRLCHTSDAQVVERGSCIVVGLPWGASGAVEGADRLARLLSRPLAGSRLGEAARWALLLFAGLCTPGRSGQQLLHLPGQHLPHSERGTGAWKDTATI